MLDMLKVEFLLTNILALKILQVLMFTEAPSDPNPMSLSFHSGKPFLSNESSMLFRIPAASALAIFSISITESCEIYKTSFNISINTIITLRKLYVKLDS
jgi:hypothetical protein